jgi:hypothetical protein
VKRNVVSTNTLTAHTESIWSNGRRARRVCSYTLCPILFSHLSRDAVSVPSPNT